MKCAHCGGENAEGKKFCGDCGMEFRTVAAPVPVPGEDGVYFCAKHKKEPTRVTCGKCEKPICHKCLVLSPAGVRCKDCSRNKVKMRPRGVVHDLAGGVTRSPIAQRAWYLVAIYFIINIISTMFGGGRRG
jgi:hypothetical protein